MDVQQSFGFVLEFHLPYLALRPAGNRKDDRDRRRRHKLPTRDEARMRGAAQRWEYHEAQISLLLVGPDEWFWTAYCLVDTFFGSEKSVVDYLGSDPPLDPSGGGTIFVNEPIWSPREYFLKILSARLEQVSQEWSDLGAAIDAQLVDYVTAHRAPQ